MCVCTRTKNDVSVTVTKRAAPASNGGLNWFCRYLSFLFARCAGRARRHGPLLMIALPGRTDGRAARPPTQNTATRAPNGRHTERDTREPLIAGVCKIWTHSLSLESILGRLLCAQGWESTNLHHAGLLRRQSRLMNITRLSLYFTLGTHTRGERKEKDAFSWQTKRWNQSRLQGLRAEADFSSSPPPLVPAAEQKRAGCKKAAIFASWWSRRYFMGPFPDLYLQRVPSSSFYCENAAGASWYLVF